VASPGRALDQALDDLVAAPGLHLAAVVVQGGDVIGERYSDTAGADTPLISWSMAKSVTHALVGLLVRDEKLTLEGPAPVPEWADPSDPRRGISLQHLLEMRPGLRFVEDYVDAGVSHCIEMLFGAGQHDVAAYAAALPLDHAPGTHWNYSSGTTNIVSRICGDAIGGGEPAVRAYLQERLFGPLGMTSADPRFDAAGTFIGSSFLYATARDFARFGELYLRDGCVAGERLLPAGWVAHATASVPVPDTEPFGYGSHWWLWRDPTDPPGTFAAQGYECQRVVVVPALDAVVVRLGKTPAADAPQVNAAIRGVLAALR
jgi:CubicO group peptidase (beta-lactamase class C family)